MINKIKRNISELKVTLGDLKRGVYPNVEHDLFGEYDDETKANTSNSALTSQTPNGMRCKNGGV